MKVVRSGALVAAFVVGATATARPPRAKSAALPNLPKPQLCAAGLIPGYFDPQNLGEPPVLSATSAALFDYDTGEMLWAKNPDVKSYPASTTKIMTGLLFAENTQPGDKVVCNDPNITKVGESSLFIQPGDTFTAQNLLYGFVLKSANDGGVLIAEHVAGSVARFSEMMTARAKELGATNTNFVNPHGLHNSKHYTTARDLGLISREAMRNLRFEETVSNPPRRTISRTNKAGQTVLTVVQSKARKSFYDKCDGADGIKTGFTNPARHCYVGSATRGGRRLIGVILGAPSNASGDTIPLLNWGFSRFPAKTVAVKDTPVAKVAVRSGIDGEVATTASRTLHVPGDVTGGRKIETEIVSTDVVAPISKGQPVGKLIVRVNGKQVGEVALLASKPVAKSVVKAAVRASFLPLGVGLGVCGAGALALIGVRHGRVNGRRGSAATKSAGGRRGGGKA